MKSAAARPLADEYLTWDEACALVKLSKEALRARIKRGTFPRTCYSTSLGELRFLRSEIDRWMADGARDQKTERLEELRHVSRARAHVLHNDRFQRTEHRGHES